MILPWREMLWLFAISLAVRGLAMLPIAHPGYMDAAYSYDIALNLARGNGLNEPFLWLYLDDPAGLPHPSHLYWMPLPTLLAWLGITMFGHTYRAAQVPFVILSALLPLVGFAVAWQVSQRRLVAWVAGLLTVFSGFFIVYWGHTDNFTPFALAGSMCLVAGWRGVRAAPHPPAPSPQSGEGGVGWLLIAGALAGLAHLSRADGVLLLGVIGLGAMWHLRRARRQVGLSLVCLTAGYGLVILPWFVRNVMVAGTPLSGAGLQTIWLTRYDELFSYGRELSAAGYLAWGWDNILASKLQALWLNAQTAVAVLGMVFLAPLAVAGSWRLRRHGLMQLAGGYALLLFVVMTFVFTFPGPRGGLFHSGGALLPFINVVALVGLDWLVASVAARRRMWNPTLARRVFAVGLVGLAVLMSAFIYYRGVVVATRWRLPDATYTRLAAWLDARGESSAPVMVGDPAGYWYISGGPALVVPDGPPETALAVAERYGARYLVLDANRPAQLAPLYAGDIVEPRLQPVHRFDDAGGRPVVVFEIGC
jgi:hypothetical protein